MGRDISGDRRKSSMAYFVIHPRSGTVAEVKNAGNTKHARTALLDYLSRKGLIGWEDRQGVRSELKVIRGEPGEIQTTIELDYSGAKAEVIPQGGSGVPQAAPAPAPESQPTPQPRQVPRTGGISVLPSASSPIAQMSRGLARVRRL